MLVSATYSAVTQSDLVGRRFKSPRLTKNRMATHFIGCLDTELKQIRSESVLSTLTNSQLLPHKQKSHPKVA